jgi:hypothetical protein
MSIWVLLCIYIVEVYKVAINLKNISSSKTTVAASSKNKLPNSAISQVLGH